MITPHTTLRLGEYLAEAHDRTLPAEVVTAAKHHLVDTLAAAISGVSLDPGRMAIAFARLEGASDEASIIGARMTGTAATAAFANGMSAHADETDDSNGFARIHPGCAVVPAAMAVAERQHSSGMELLRAIVAGYDAGCRVGIGLGPVPGRVEASVVDPLAVGGTFGAAAAAATLLQLRARQMCSVLAYAAQQAWGFGSYMRSPDHVEKAFVFGGCQARDGVLSALMVHTGFLGTEDVFDGKVNYLDSISPMANHDALIDGLGERFEVLRTSMKRYPVGMPIQPVVEAVRRILADATLSVADIERVELHMPAGRAAIVDNRDMPDVNVQYVVAVMLLDGGLSYASAHDFGRMLQPEVQALRQRIALIAEQGDTRALHARVEIHATDGRVLKQEASGPDLKGSPDNRMTSRDVEEKAFDLVESVTGSELADKLVGQLMRIEEVEDVHLLRPLLLEVQARQT